MNKLQVIEMIERHRTPLKRWLGDKFRMSMPDANDLIQTIYVRILQSESTAEIEEPLRYARVAARNYIYEQRQSLKYKSRQRGGSWALLYVEDMSPSAQQTVEFEEHIRLIGARLKHVSGRTRRIFVMHRFEGYTYGEIAKKFSLSEDGVKKALRRATDRIMEHEQDVKPAHGRIVRAPESTKTAIERKKRKRTKGDNQHD